MQKTKKDSTEEKILKAAQSVFITKGMDGARMQEIADEAGINKALLHYYFRSKQKLFEAISKNLFAQIFPNIQSLLDTSISIENRIGSFIENYIDIILKSPYLPAFILKEVNRDSSFVESVFKNMGIDPKQIIKTFENEMDNGNLVRMDPRDIMINLLAMSLFPFAAKPLFQLMLFENDSTAYNAFLKERKSTVKTFVLNSVLKRSPGN